MICKQLLAFTPTAKKKKQKKKTAIIGSTVGNNRLTFYKLWKIRGGVTSIDLLICAADSADIDTLAGISNSFMYLPITECIFIHMYCRTFPQ